MKKLTAYIATILISSPLFAARISDSQLELGRESAAEDKEILFNIGEGAGNPKIRANYGTKKLEFTNDGTNFSEFGTGGDLGGYNIIDNPGFESDLTNWTNTGSGSLSVNTNAADVYQGDKSALWDAAAANDILASQAVTIPGGLRGNLCSVEMQYKGGDDNLKLQAFDGTNVLAEVALVASGNFAKAMVTFICPSSGTLQGRLIASANAAAVYVDNWVVGKSADILTALDRKVYTTGSDCANVGSLVNNTETNLNCSLDLPAGLYQLDASAVARATYSVAPTRARARLLFTNSTGSQLAGGASVGLPIAGSDNSGAHLKIQHIINWSGGVIQLRGSVAVDAGTVTNREIIFPAITATLLDEEVGNVQRVETSAWSVQAFMNGGAPALVNTSNVKLSSSNNLDIGGNFGSISAQILCDGAVSTGNNCSGVDELQGIVFDVPRAGKAMACVSGRFNWSETSGFTDFNNVVILYRVAADGTVSAGDIDVTWTPLSQIINQQVFQNEGSTGTWGNWNQSDPYSMCGIVDLVAGKNALAVANSQTMNSGNPTTNQLFATRWTVFPIEQQLPQALITQGRVYFEDCPTNESVAQATWTYLNCSIYLPAGKYAIEINSNSGVVASVLPTLVQGNLQLSTDTTTSGETFGGRTIGLARVSSTNYMGQLYYSGLEDWPGGILYLLGRIETLGGTITSRTIHEKSIKATRLD